MAKSLRAKAKNANRRKKRSMENSVYVAAEAERVQRISDRLMGKHKAGAAAGAEAMEEAEGERQDEVDVEGDAEMAEAAPKKVSTSGPRESRKDSWRKSKGMPARRVRSGKLGQAVSKNSSGKPKRRR